MVAAEIHSVPGTVRSQELADQSSAAAADTAEPRENTDW